MGYTQRFSFQKHPGIPTHLFQVENENQKVQVKWICGFFWCLDATGQCH